jgi:hypothetical protein
MATAQELTARQAYNDRVRTLKTLQIANGLDKGYEKEVDGLVAEFGQWISPQEIGDTVYNTYAGYGGNLVPATKYYGGFVGTNQADGVTAPTDPYAPTTTGGTDTTALQTSIADLEAQQAAVRAQFEPLFAQYMAELQSGLTRNKDDLKKSYTDNAELNDKRYGEGLQNIQRGYAARGIGDSSYKENATQGLQGDFGRIYGDLTTQYNRGNQDLDKQVADKTASANAMKNNFYNPDRPQFTDVNQVASYAGTLASQLENAKTSLSSANARLSSAGISNPAGDDKMFQEYAANQVEQGTPWGTVAESLKSRGQTDPSYDAYLSYLYGSKEGDS